MNIRGAKSMAKLKREIKEYRRSIARADASSGLVETLLVEKKKVKQHRLQQEKIN